MADQALDQAKGVDTTAAAAPMATTATAAPTGSNFQALLSKQAPDIRCEGEADTEQRGYEARNRVCQLLVVRLVHERERQAAGRAAQLARLVERVAKGRELIGCGVLLGAAAMYAVGPHN